MNFAKLPIYKILLPCLLVWLGTPDLSRATSVLIAIDNTGANDRVNVDNPRVWNFGIANSGTTLTVNRALFGLNDGGNNTNQNITFSLYSGLGGNQSVSNTLLFSVSLTPAQVDGFYTTMEEFAFSTFTFSAGNYSAMLTTTQPAGNGSYFLKLGKLTLYNDTGGAVDPTTGTPLSPTLWTQDANDTGTAAVPEPSVAWLLLVGLGAWAIVRSRKSVA